MKRAYEVLIVSESDGKNQAPSDTGMLVSCHANFASDHVKDELTLAPGLVMPGTLSVKDI